MKGKEIPDGGKGKEGIVFASAFVRRYVPYQQGRKDKLQERGIPEPLRSGKQLTPKRGAIRAAHA
jgi:hypothetical protein